MIDTRVDTRHPALLGAKVEYVDRRRRDRRAPRFDHGTAVASILVGAASSQVVGVIPEAKLFAANAFHRRGATEKADTYDLLSALDWLAEQNVSVINMSLSGPANPLLQAAIKQIQANGTVIVAAVGRPSKRSGYPAKYPGVVGVAALDTRLRVSRRSARGEHVAFAAPGVGIMAAVSRNRIRRLDGSSFAAPFVAAAIAVGRSQNLPAPKLVELLASSARDLGAPGRDPVYGWGLLQFTKLTNCRSD